MLQLEYFQLKRGTRLSVDDGAVGEKAKGEQKSGIIAYTVLLRLAAWQLNSSSSLRSILSSGATETLVTFKAVGIRTASQNYGESSVEINCSEHSQKCKYHNTNSVHVVNVCVVRHLLQPSCLSRCYSCRSQIKNMISCA